MVTGIILYFVISLILVPIFTKLQKKYKNHGGRLLVLFIVVITSIGIITPILPLVTSINNVIGDAEAIHSYGNIGTLYYDSHTDTYFMAECNNWKIINMYERVDIDYELGKSIHDAKDLIESSEYMISYMIK